MKNLKTQKGITLIALVITIIVMLILVIVTVSFALNGDLFNKANTAALDTEKQSVYEQALAAMVLRRDGTLDVDETGKAAQANLQANGFVNPVWNYDLGNNTGVLTVTGKRGTVYLIEITENGIGQPTISSGNESNVEPGASEEFETSDEIESSDETGENNGSGFPEQYYGRCYKRDGGVFSYAFVNNNSSIIEYGIDVEYNMLDGSNELEIVTYDSVISELNEIGLEYNLGLSNTDDVAFAFSDNTEDERGFFIFYDNYTKCAETTYYYDEEEDEAYIGVDDTYTLQSADFLDLSEFLN